MARLINNANAKMSDIVTNGFTFAQAPEYAVEISVPEGGGIITSDKSEYKAGDLVTLSVVPEEGMELSELSVKIEEVEIEVTKVSDGTYTFTMPAGDVMVEGEFEVAKIKGVRFTNAGDGVATIGYHPVDTITPTFYYRITGGNWTDWDYSSIELQPGEYVDIAGDNDSSIGGYDPYPSPSTTACFTMTGSISASGNIMYLLSKDDPDSVVMPSGAFQFLFYGCTSLIAAPELPATELTEYCYSHMFDRCTSLTTAPELPATELTRYCYSNMFYGCTYLTTAPELPAIELTEYCYSSMFNGCTSLESLTCLATDISAFTCIDNWLSDISTTGTLYVDPSMTGATWNTPQTWTVQAISE